MTELVLGPKRGVNGDEVFTIKWRRSVVGFYDLNKNYAEVDAVDAFGRDQLRSVLQEVFGPAIAEDTTIAVKY